MATVGIGQLWFCRYCALAAGHAVHPDDAAWIDRLERDKKRVLAESLRTAIAG